MNSINIDQLQQEINATENFLREVDSVPSSNPRKSFDTLRFSSSRGTSAATAGVRTSFDSTGATNKYSDPKLRESLINRLLTEHNLRNSNTSVISKDGEGTYDESPVKDAEQSMSTSKTDSAEKHTSHHDNTLFFASDLNGGGRGVNDDDNAESDLNYDPKANYDKIGNHLGNYYHSLDTDGDLYDTLRFVQKVEQPLKHNGEKRGNFDDGESDDARDDNKDKEDGGKAGTYASTVTTHPAYSSAGGGGGGESAERRQYYRASTAKLHRYSPHHDNDDNDDGNGIENNEDALASGLDFISERNSALMNSNSSNTYKHHDRHVLNDRKDEDSADANSTATSVDSLEATSNIKISRAAVEADPNESSSAANSDGEQQLRRKNQHQEDLLFHRTRPSQHTYGINGPDESQRLDFRRRHDPYLSSSTAAAASVSRTAQRSTIAEGNRRKGIVAGVQVRSTGRSRNRANILVPSSSSTSSSPPKRYAMAHKSRDALIEEAEKDFQRRHSFVPRLMTEHYNRRSTSATRERRSLSPLSPDAAIQQQQKDNISRKSSSRATSADTADSRAAAAHRQALRAKELMEAKVRQQEELLVRQQQNMQVEMAECSFAPALSRGTESIIKRKSREQQQRNRSMSRSRENSLSRDENSVSNTPASASTPAPASSSAHPFRSNNSAVWSSEKVSERLHRDAEQREIQKSFLQRSVLETHIAQYPFKPTTNHSIQNTPSDKKEQQSNMPSSSSIGARAVGSISTSFATSQDNSNSNIYRSPSKERPIYERVVELQR